MKIQVLFYLILSLLNSICQFGECLNVYKAGVVEYYYDVESKLEPRLILERNINKYVSLIEEFHKKWPHVQNGILVFPECGLASLSNARSIAVAVPEPDISQNNFTGFMIINPLSKAAIKTHTWLVINLVEMDGSKLYNTDVVIRSNGTIAAKYRKYNLFNEPVNKPSKAEVVSFTTDFNVTFGIFTCFDILYSHPALDLVRKGIKHMIFPTAWYSELPFLTAVQYQKAWSWANNVSLLAAGLSYSKFGSTGSGIYRGQQGDDTYYQTSNSNESHLLMAVFDIHDEDFFETSRLNLASDETVDETKSNKHPGLKLLHESMKAYSTVLIQPDGCKIPADHVIPGSISNCTKTILQNITHRHLSCNFNLQYDFNVYICKDKTCRDAKDFQPKSTAEDDFSLSLHRLAAFDGVRSFYVTTGGVETCAVVSCSDEEVSSCGYSPKPKHLYCFSYDNHRACVLQRYIRYVKIGGNFKQNNTLVSPNILLRSNNDASGFGKITNHFHMINHSGYYSLEYKVPTDDVLGTAAIWSRNFDTDGQTVTGKSSTISLPVVITVTLILVYLLKYIIRS